MHICAGAQVRSLCILRFAFLFIFFFILVWAPHRFIEDYNKKRIVIEERYNRLDFGANSNSLFSTKCRPAPKIKKRDSKKKGRDDSHAKQSFSINYNALLGQHRKVKKKWDFLRMLERSSWWYHVRTHRHRVYSWSIGHGTEKFAPHQLELSCTE